MKLLLLQMELQKMFIKLIFKKIFTNEPVPINGEITLADLPGFGAEFNDEVELEEI